VREPWWSDLGDRRLVVSGLGMWGGGLYELVDGDVVAIDDLSSVGICLGGGAAWRALRSPGEFTGSCELLRYDEHGVDRYWRLDAVRDPHDLCWHDGALHVVSSWDSVVWRFDGDRLDALWRGGAVADSWHANCLVSAGGRLYLSAFGRGDGHKAFGGDDAPATGFVTEITDVSGSTAGRADVASGLAQPHHPRPHGDGWLVCESTRGALTHVDVHGRTRRLDLGRYTRGLAVEGRWAYVGGNARRGEEVGDAADRGEVVVVDLDRWCVVDRVRLPCLEVYDILPVPPHLLAGLRRGFATNAFRAAEQLAGAARSDAERPAPEAARLRLATDAQANELAASSRALPLDCLLGSVTAAVPAVLEAGSWVTIAASVTNGSTVTWVTAPPHPLGVAPRWYRLDAAADDADAPTPEEPIVGPTTALPSPLAPAATADVEVLVGVPAVPGRYRLSLTLRQKGVSWFGERVDAEILVVRRDGTSGNADTPHFRPARK
jgi:hypothetical protein